MLMKVLGLVASIILTPTLYASDSNTAPLGLQEMLSELVSVSAPEESTSKEFYLERPASRSNFHLSLFPENAFEKVEHRNGYLVRVVSPELIYDMELFYDNRMVMFIRDDIISYRWSTEGSGRFSRAGGRTTCVQNVTFYHNGQELTLQRLNFFQNRRGMTYTYNFNRSALEQDENDPSSFTRLNNQDASVQLIIYNADGSVFYNHTQAVPPCDGSSSDVTTSPASPSTDSWERIPFRERDYQAMRNSVAIDFGRIKRILFSRNFRIRYTGTLHNPFFDKITCDVHIESINMESYVQLDYHIYNNIIVGPRQSSTFVEDRFITARRTYSGNRQDALAWAQYWRQRAAKNCYFLVPN